VQRVAIDQETVPKRLPCLPCHENAMQWLWAQPCLSARRKKAPAMHLPCASIDSMGRAPLPCSGRGSILVLSPVGIPSAAQSAASTQFPYWVHRTTDIDMTEKQKSQQHIDTSPVVPSSFHSAPHRRATSSLTQERIAITRS